MSAKVRLPAETFKVFPVPTVISLVAIVAPSTVPPLISGLVNVLLVKVCVWSLKTNSSSPDKSGRVTVRLAVNSLDEN